MASVYARRRAVLTTMHRKETAIRPSFEKILGLRIDVDDGVDTEALGTFTGEIKRQGPMFDVAIKKARLGMARSGSVLGIASEGSFGPHPGLPFLAGAVELMVFVDDEAAIAVHETLITETTNYSHRRVRAGEKIDGFLRQIGFPDHAVIVRPEPIEERLPINKGITSAQSLEKALRAAIDASPLRTAWLGTDMRANFNPTRMKSLGQLSDKLARRIACLCPSCSMPGWGTVDAESGLPCERCGNPTELAKTTIMGCVNCDFREALPRADGLQSAAPYYCSLCNP